MQPRTLPSVAESPMMTRQEAATYLHVSIHTIGRMIQRGDLRARKFKSGTVRIYRASVEEVAS